MSIKFNITKLESRDLLVEKFNYFRNSDAEKNINLDISAEISEQFTSLYRKYKSFNSDAYDFSHEQIDKMIRILEYLGATEETVINTMSNFLF